MSYQRLSTYRELGQPRAARPILRFLTVGIRICMVEVLELEWLSSSTRQIPDRPTWVSIFFSQYPPNSCLVIIGFARTIRRIESGSFAGESAGDSTGRRRWIAIKLSFCQRCAA